MSKKFHFTSEAWDYNNKRLTNQIFKLLPMYENGEDWVSQKETIRLELLGYNDVFQGSPNFMILVAKLEALKYADDQMVFRKLIFEAITALKEIII